MKKPTISLISFLLLSIAAAFAQKPVMELTFTAEYNDLHVPLDSILIQNLTQPGDTILYPPDTMLLLNYPVGLPENSGTAMSSFSVSPNYPNPSVDGKTSIDVFVPVRENVKMQVVDVRGGEVAFYENTLDAGIHHFTFLAGKERFYLLSVNYGSEIRSVKMINSGNSSQMQGTLIYEGISEAVHPLKSLEAITGFEFSLGDQLRFIGYSKNTSDVIGSDVIEATPEGNEDFVFKIIEGIPCPGLPIVTYQSQTYKTVQIGNQCWFKENLNTGTMIPGTQNQSNNSVVEKYCYDNDPENCELYGGLYQWNEMMQYSAAQGIQGICPPDWHLPADAEWTVLIDYLGGESVAGGKMKSVGTIEEETGFWYFPNTGAINSSGFSGHPGGYSENTGNFVNLGNTGLWWSSTELSATNAWHRYITYGDTYAFLYNYNKNYGFSVRCVQNENAVSIPSVTTTMITEINQVSATGGGEVTDDGGSAVTSRGVCWSTSENPTIADSHTVDGSGLGPFESILTYLSPNTPYFVRAYATNNLGTAYGDELNFTTLPGSFTCGDVVSYEGQDYNTILMGTQCWFLDNLNVGTMVTQNQTNNGVVEKYCYNDDPANCEIYGGLYDWEEVMQYSTQPGIQAICPTGWHIPTDEEFTTLTDYISSQPAYFCDNSGFNNAKAIATTTGWDTSSEYCAVGNDQSANNASGFTGMPVGMRMDNGSGFDGAGYLTTWYSSTESSGFAAKGRMIAADYWYILTSMMSKNYGMSVRCLKD